MTRPIRFTEHAMKKFVDLQQMGFAVTAEQVIEALTQPGHIDTDVSPPIAQRAITERHLLRVVFVEEPDEMRVITFYPARRKRYEP